MLLRLGRGMTLNKCGAVAGGGSPYLDGVLQSVCCDLDATLEDSYGGSGTTWANLIASPADGAAQADYDFGFGNGADSGTYPTFTGSAGDASAYFAFDGGDFFTIKGASNPTTVADIAKTNKSHWMAYAMYSAFDSNMRFFDAWDGTNGLDWFFNASTGLALIQEQGGSMNSKFGIRDVSDFTADAPIIMVLSYDYATAKVRTWISEAVGSEQNIQVDPGINDAGRKGTIGAREDGNLPFVNGTRLYSFAMGNEFLDDTKAAAIIVHLGARHGRDYTV